MQEKRERKKRRHANSQTQLPQQSRHVSKQARSYTILRICTRFQKNSTQKALSTALGNRVDADRPGQGRRRSGRAGAAPSPAFALVHAGNGIDAGALPELAAHAAHPLAVLVAAEPVLAANGEHGAAELAGPALPFLAALGEGVLRELVGRVARVQRVLRGRRHHDVLAEHGAGVGEHDDDEVDADGPQRRDDGDAHDAAALEDGAAEPRGREAAVARRADGHGLLARCQAIGGRRHHVNLADVVLGVGEAGRVADHLAAGPVAAAARLALVRVLRQDQEPRDAEGGRVGGVDDGVDGVQPGEGKAAQRVLLADIAGQVDGEEEDNDGVDVHGQLQRRDVVAGREGQDAVETGDLVDENGEDDQLDAGAQRHGVEESLQALVSPGGWSRDGRVGAYVRTGHLQQRGASHGDGDGAAGLTAGSR